MDDIFAALAHRNRRLILYHLRDQEVMSVYELAGHLAARDAGTPPDQVSAAERERVAVQVLHTHLPKLADARLLEYDHRSRTVRATDLLGVLEKTLRLFRTLELEDGE